MPGSTELLCDRCPFTQELSTVLACYRLSQREAIPIFAELAWCHACRRVVQAEKFVGVEEIRQELLRTGDWLPFSLDRYGEGEWVHLEYWLSRVDSKCLNSARTRRKAYVRLLRSMLRWRRERRSPPRCLTCGSTKLEYFTAGDGVSVFATLVHPGCGGVISFRGYCIDIVIGGDVAEYSPEGLEIPLDRNVA